MLTRKHVEGDQTGTGRPVLVDQEEEHKIDFRAPGLLHSVVKEAEHLRVQELVKRIENHPHREALQADLQQKNVYKPIQQQFEGDDPRIGQCRVIRVMRNNSKSGMCTLSSLLESTICVLHLRTMLDDSESRRKYTNYDWMHRLSRTT